MPSEPENRCDAHVVSRINVIDLLCSKAHARRIDVAASAPDTASLGKTGLTVSSLGIGTLQWGDTQCGYGKQYDDVSTCHVQVHSWLPDCFRG